MEEAEELCTRIAIMNKGKIAALDTTAALIAGVNKAEATLEDAFAFYTGANLEEESGGNWRDARAARRTARRLG
jgi:ABC-2 type transport system ATP-binding protein